MNTDLQPFDLEDIKKEVDQGNQTKKSKALWEAFQIAAENHDLAWFKDMLKHHEEAVQADAEEKLAAEQKKQEKKDKAAKRKSIAAADEDEDVDMEDPGNEGTTAAKKAKASKKRKKDEESEGESEKVILKRFTYVNILTNNDSANEDSKSQAYSETQRGIYNQAQERDKTEEG